MDFKTIGIRIKRCRRNKGLTQEKFAELIDVSPHYIYEIERGSKTMSLYTLDRIVTTLNISADYLLYGSLNYDLSSDKSHDTSDKLLLLFDALSSSKKESLLEVIEFLLPRLK